MRCSPTSEHSSVRRIEIDLADLDLERFCTLMCCVNALWQAVRASAEVDCCPAFAASLNCSLQPTRTLSLEHARRIARAHGTLTWYL